MNILSALRSRYGTTRLLQVLFTLFFYVNLLGITSANNPTIDDSATLSIPPIGATGLRILTPTSLELTLINTKDPAPARVPLWDFVSDNLLLTTPAPSEFTVTVNGATVPVSRVGFKRRPLFAPLNVRDLRLQDCLYLELSSVIPDNANVQVTNPNARLWTSAHKFTATASPTRWNPAIHVNQSGYMPYYPKKAVVGYFIGSLGELNIPMQNGFRLLDKNGNVVFTGNLTLRRDTNFTVNPAPYQQVWQADFSSFERPGEYRLQIPGMGVSFPFQITEGVAANFTRSFALGLYHQRCGTAIGLPHTRHEHGICHAAPASIPTMEPTFAKVQEFLAAASADFANNKRHTAPRLQSVASSLYPFVNSGKINVSRGHHDAGDYSKYTINSAGLIHHLVFAADAFPGVAQLDNLGLPESGDGKSDILQEAKWEADFLASMQDADGGFYFLVYPKDRRYENDVMPDKSDPQVVWPKTTAVTAAAVAALAEIGSSPTFKQQFPAEAANYLQKAQLGWSFLMNAIAKYGKDGSYQKITHYGNEFMHDDELAWAAAAMYAATGNSVYHTKLMEWFPDPNAVSTRRWNWWRLFEGYGSAVRTYAFAARSGRLQASRLDANYLARCESEIQAAANDHVRFSNQSSYGTSFPDANKRQLTAGWFFSSERAFDITTAYQLTPRADYLEAVIANINYEGGSNPVNMTFVTGMGLKRQRDIVHQHAQNDRQVLPPSGIPQGNVVDGLGFLYAYGSELGRLSFPSDFSSTAPYPIFDRWSDSYHTKNEFVVVDSARSLASLAFWMAQSSVKSQPWKAAVGEIAGLPSVAPAGQPITLTLSAPGIDLSNAIVTWEVLYLEPAIGNPYTFTPKYTGEHWVEAEALLPDGRRIFAVANFTATTAIDTPPNSFLSAPLEVTPDLAALFHADNSPVDASGKTAGLTLSGNARFDVSNLGWMSERSGAALRFLDLGDKATVQIPGGVLADSQTSGIKLEAMIYINDFKAYNRGPATIFSLKKGYETRMELREDTYQGLFVEGGRSYSFSGSQLLAALTKKAWHHLSLELNKNGYAFRINGQLISSGASGDLASWINTQPATLELGNFDGWIDEIAVRNVRTGSSSAPVVTLTSPTTNSSHTAPATLTLSANVTSSSAIARVEFFANNNKVGEDTTSPYSISWNDVAAGSYSISARATDANGLTGTSASAAVVVQTMSTVATPTITPGSGTFTGPTSVTLTCATAGATIRYTIDGSTPVATSTAYTAPFTISKSTTVQAKAFKSGMNESATAAVTLNITTVTSNRATFIGEDSATRGNWRGAYGVDGYNLFGFAENNPSFAQVTATGAYQYIWTESTSDPRALLKTTGSDRMCITWYTPTSMTFDLNFTDSLAHKVSFYFLDWDRGGRSELIEVIDPSTGNILDSRTVANFQDGKYLSWEVRGRVQIRATRQTGPNALAMALFFDPASSQDSASLQPIGPVNGQGFKLKLTGTVGKNYRIQSSEDHKTWKNVGEVTMTSPTLEFVDKTAPNQPHRFYRANLP